MTAPDTGNIEDSFPEQSPCLKHPLEDFLEFAKAQS
jgi:hypothetical protein